MLLQQFRHTLTHNFLHLFDMPDYILIYHILHGLVSSDAAHRMRLVGCSPANRVCSEVILNLLPETDAGQW